MTKLNDVQLLLLATAAARADGSLLPPPDQLADFATKVRRAVVALIKQALVEEVEGADGDRVWREEGSQRFAAAITAAGRVAIGAPVPPILEVATVPPAGAKIDAVVALLARDEGATLPELIAATGWLPHTTRAALTRLRQKGHRIDRATRDGATCYRVTATAA